LPKIQIVIKIPLGKFTPVDLNSGDSVRMIMEKIERLENELKKN
jgi:archaellum component FlaC